MIYHYSDRDTARDIRQSGEIRTAPVRVYADVLGGGGRELAPAAWFTKAEDCPTVRAKLLSGGWPLLQPRMFWRFQFPDDAAPLELPTWACEHEYDPGLFRFMLLTAMLAGEDWSDWRLSNDPVSLDLCQAIEYREDGQWKRFP